jgi:hypothetical protein
VPDFLAGQLHNVQQVEVIGGFLLLTAVALYGSTVPYQKSADGFVVIGRLCLLSRHNELTKLCKPFE